MPDPSQQMQMTPEQQAEAMRMLNAISGATISGAGVANAAGNAMGAINQGVRSGTIDPQTGTREMMQNPPYRPPATMPSPGDLMQSNTPTQMPPITPDMIQKLMGTRQMQEIPNAPLNPSPPQPIPNVPLNYTPKFQNM